MLPFQVLHYSSLQINPKKDGEVFYLHYDDLPHMINPIEGKLGMSYICWHIFKDLLPILIALRLWTARQRLVLYSEQFVIIFIDIFHVIFAGSHISLYPSLNFVVYVPSKKHSPIYMKNKDGETTYILVLCSFKSFISKEWSANNFSLWSQCIVEQ